MRTAEIIMVLDNEKKCVERNIKGCDRDCGSCDLVLSDDKILKAYDEAINRIVCLDEIRRSMKRFPDLFCKAGGKNIRYTLSDDGVRQLLGKYVDLIDEYCEDNNYEKKTGKSKKAK